MSNSLHTTYPGHQSGQQGSTGIPTKSRPVQADKGEQKIVAMVAAIGTVFAITFGVFWMSAEEESRTTPASTATPMATTTQAKIVERSAVIPKPSLVTVRTDAGSLPTWTPVAAPIPTQLQEVREADLLFDFGRNGLSDDARANLRAYAAFLEREPDWGVIIQGHTDTQGSSTYNRKLGAKRAEAVRAFLAELGIAESRMKVVSLGEDAALCQDQSRDCQRVNRRVHLEFLKVGALHLAPAAPVMQATDPASGLDRLATVAPEIAEAHTSEVLSIADAEPSAEEPLLVDEVGVAAEQSEADASLPTESAAAVPTHSRVLADEALNPSGALLELETIVPTEAEGGSGS